MPRKPAVSKRDGRHSANAQEDEQQQLLHTVKFQGRQQKANRQTASPTTSQVKIK